MLGSATDAKGSARPVVIVNPRSAGGQTRRRWFHYEHVLRDSLGAFDPIFTERPGHATELARAALRSGVDLVVAMGGDGTLNEVVNGFFDDGVAIRPGAAFALLPAGTGGDFPKTTGTPRDFEHAARGLPNARRRAIDLGRLTYLDHEGSTRQRYFVNVASFGIGGLVVRHVNRSSKALGGRASFLLATVRASLAYTNARVRLSFDDRPAEERVVYSVAVANGRFFGGGMQIAPDAKLDDGQFDVVTIGDVSMARMSLHASAVYAGTHVKLPFVTVERARRVHAESANGEEVLLDVDGEQPGRLPATFELLPGAISVVA